MLPWAAPGKHPIFAVEMAPSGEGDAIGTQFNELPPVKMPYSASSLMELHLQREGIAITIWGLVSQY